MTLFDQEKVIAKVTRAIEQVRAGGMVIMVDDEDRENEGDLVFAAEFATPELVNFMVKEARGLVCLTLEGEMVDRLRLPMMGDTAKSGGSHGTAFTVSIEAKRGVTTGISAHDRCQTILTAIHENAKPEDIVVPGHIFPLKARSGGVLERAGHTEGSVDLARLAGLKGAGVICEIMNDDGSMARMPDLEAFAKKHNLPIVAIADLIAYRLLRESLVRELDRQPIKTEYGVFTGVLFENMVDQTKHFALVKGEPFGEDCVEVRVHSQRPLQDVFGTSQEGGRQRLVYGLELLQKSEHAVMIYLTEPEMEWDLVAEMRELAALSTERGGATAADTQKPEPMDWRLHGTGAQILRYLGVKSMRVHASSVRHLVGLHGFGLEIVETKLITPEVSL